MKFGALDYGVILAYLVGVVLFGLSFRKRQRTLNDYFLAGRATSWWALALSMVATETSVLSLVGLPGLAYATDMKFFQTILGNLVGRILVCIIFVPKYYSGEYVTAYQLIGTQFGPRLRRAASGVFLFTRALAEGVRLYAAAIVIALILETNVVIAIAILVLLTLIYTAHGGVTAVIWTDVVQFAVYMAGMACSFYYILNGIPGGWADITRIAGDKLTVLDFSLDPFVTYTVWSGLFAGVFQIMAFQGTDQLLVQRLLAARNKSEGNRVVLATAIIVTFQYFVFLLLGVALYVFFKQHPPSGSFEVSDQALPYFIVHHLPSGIAGLVIAGMLAAQMSTTSGSLNSMAAASVTDFYPGAGRLSHKNQFRLSRGFTVLWALVLIGLATLARNWGSVVEAGMTVLGITYGSLLGIFLLGILTRMRNETAGLMGMGASLATMLAIKFLTPIPFTWYFAIGTAVAFAVGWTSGQALRLMASLKTSRRGQQPAARSR